MFGSRLCPDPLRSLSAPTDPLAVKTGSRTPSREKQKGKGTEKRRAREGGKGRGQIGREGGGRGRAKWEGNERRGKGKECGREGRERKWSFAVKF